MRSGEINGMKRGGGLEKRGFTLVQRYPTVVIEQFCLPDTLFLTKNQFQSLPGGGVKKDNFFIGEGIF